MTDHRIAFLYVLVLLALRSSFALGKFINNIRISTQGDDSRQCLTGKDACKTLEFVFSHIQQRKRLQNSTLIVVDTGFYALNKSFCFENLTDFSIEGSSGVLQTNEFNHNKAEVQCSKGSGLTFLRCKNLSFTKIIFERCGSWQNSTSMNNPRFLTALFVVYCENLQISRCRISKSPGAGVTLYDVGGDVVLEHNVFMENRATTSWNFTYGNGTVRSGGGLHLELTYCGALYPFDCGNLETDKYNSRSIYTIRNCSFIRNNATVGAGIRQTFDTNPRGKTFNSIGRGGGMSFFIKGNATGNKFLIEYCNFSENAADWGAGYALYFQDNSKRNLLLVRETLFHRNTAKYGGGAVKCAITVFETFSELIKHEPNHYTYKNCIFHRNTATEGWGGAFSAFGSTSYLGSQGWRNNLTSAFINCSWSENLATAGAAIGVLTKPNDLWRETAGLPEHGFGYAIKLINNTFQNNKITVTRNHVIVYGMGTIYSVSVPIIMIGNVNFIENSNTALVLDSASAEIAGNVLFYKNNGVNGGAVGIYGKSALVLDEGAHLTFRENTASGLAGAIFVRTAGPDIAAFNKTIFNRHWCFFRYYDESSLPKDWNVSVVFQGNNASLNVGRTVYANTLQFCRFGQEGQVNDALKNWTHFKFLNENGTDSNDLVEIATEPVQILVQDRHEWLHVSPYEEFSPVIQLLDERNHSVHGLIKVSVQAENVYQPVTLDGNISPYFFVNGRIKSIRLRGKPSSKYNINIDTIDSQMVKLTVENLTLSHCPPGFTERDNICQCLTVKDKVSGISRCGADGQSLYLRKGLWGGPTSSLSDCSFSVFQCPDGFCKCGESNKSDGLIDECECLYDASNQCVSTRTGDLCGQCKQGLSVKIGTYECSKCDKNDAFWLIPYFLLLTVIVFIVIYFKLDFFSGYLNCWLYTYQITYLVLPDDFLTGDPLMNFVIKLANGQFVFGSWCLWSGMDDLQKLSFGYVSYLYQLLLLFVFAKLSSKFSIFQGNYFRPFCTILILSYSEIVAVTLKQLHPVYLCPQWRVYRQGTVQFFRGKHIPHASVAIIVLFGFVLPFPITLASSSFFINRFPYLARVSIPLLDVLQSCYRPERSWFAAFYIFCRLVAVIIYTYMPFTYDRHKILTMFCIVVLVAFLLFKPYKNDTFTLIDTFHLSFLLLISVLAEVIATCSLYTSLFYQVCFYIIHVLLYIPFLYSIVLLYFHLRIRKQYKEEERVKTVKQEGTQTSHSDYEPL